MQFSQRSLFGYVCGIALVGCSLFSFAVSKTASVKLASLHHRMVSEHGVKDENAIRGAFQTLDANGDGSLDSKEFASCASSLGSALSDDELAAIFELIDLNNSGKIDFEEFRLWWLGDKSVDFSYV
mmetsp:Transcript_18978/g.63568  ORF Transcript_18978/g.63568 Transcript_18978/m.63568 type:complete len:126 (+) Transcript_18978:1-378(+)